MAKTLEEITAEVRAQMNRNPKAWGYRIEKGSVERLLEAADEVANYQNIAAQERTKP